MADIYKSIPAAHLKRTFIHRHRERNMTMDMGFIYPFFLKEMLPGDIFKFKTSTFIRVQPMVAAPFTPMRFYCEYWFFPTRQLMQKMFPNIVEPWETFIFGGPTGNGANENGDVPTLPRWIPNKSNVKLAKWNIANGVQSRGTGNADAKGSLWDLFNLPVGTGYHNLDNDGVHSSNGQNYYRWCPLSVGKNCYNWLWNEFKRNENIESSVDLNSEDVQQCKWKHDYFTSALPFQQRGDPVAMPLGSVLFAEVPEKVDPRQLYAYSTNENNNFSATAPIKSLDKIVNGVPTVDKELTGDGSSAFGSRFKGLNNASATSVALAVAPAELDATYTNSIRNQYDSSKYGGSATTRFPAYTQANVDVSDLRLMFQTQKFMERAARGGVRYIEGLLSFFGTAPRNDVLNLPQFIGGMKQNIVVNEVLQTSETSNTPQGNIAGRGISAAGDGIGTYSAKEHGYVLGICWIKPDLYYSGQGIPRELLRISKYDFYWPQFAHLSERPIFKSELFASPDTMTPAQMGDGVDGLFGYTGMYNEYRSEQNEICNEMRDTFKYWTLAREFSSAPELTPDFINCMPRKDIFAVQNEDEFFVDILTDIKMWRPIVREPNPGLIDHF